MAREMFHLPERLSPTDCLRSCVSKSFLIFLYLYLCWKWHKYKISIAHLSLKAVAFGWNTTIREAPKFPTRISQLNCNQRDWHLLTKLHLFDLLPNRMLIYLISTRGKFLLLCVWHGLPYSYIFFILKKSLDQNKLSAPMRSLSEIRHNRWGIWLIHLQNNSGFMSELS